MGWGGVGGDVTRCWKQNKTKNLDALEEETSEIDLYPIQKKNIE